jgi:methanogenic corrinoid protein MtbC1
VTDLATTLMALDKQAVLDEVRRRAAAGDDPAALIDECRGAMEAVGRRFQDGDLYLADLLLAADVFSGVTDVLQPYLQGAAPSGDRGMVVLATPRGDIHDLGKSIVATILRASGRKWRRTRRRPASSPRSEGGFILGTGCETAPDCRAESLRAMVETARTVTA